jgi:hypothetical protein
MSRASYEIRAVGNVQATILEDFTGITVTPDPAGSTIHVELADEAQLHGVLEALRRAGFPLVDVRREPLFDDVDQASDQSSPDP